jgi:phosphoribosylamine--glycine ligase
MKVLVVGGGGRENAICWKLSQSKKIKKLYCAPGNPGISNYAECIDIKIDDIMGLCNFTKEEDIDLVVVGPEIPLTMGLVDALAKLGVRAFGPNQKCAMLEESKSFTKEFLQRHNIPTAKYIEITDPKEAINSIGIFGWPMVIKADGLAQGKGVIIAENKADAKIAIESIMVKKEFGAAGNKIVIEEFLKGTEASVLCFVDEENIIPMESAQDYKKIYDDDLGPNTGGMGSYSPSLIFNDGLMQKIKENILYPTLAGFKADGLEYKGVLFVGLMIIENNPKVIEFNVRFGDPETQSVLMRLESDLLDIMLGVTYNNLQSQEILWSEKTAICVVLASKGYPMDYEKDMKITGLSELSDKVIAFHSGTVIKNRELLTSSGRVLGIACTGENIEEARSIVYEEINKIKYNGISYRKDIGIIVK